MSLIVITKPDGLEDIELLQKMFDEGLELLYLRKPNWAKEEYEVFFENIGEAFFSKIFVHINAPVCSEMKLWGRHFSYNDLDRSLNNNIDSVSVHSILEYEAVFDIAKQVFVSPFFDSISKEGYKQNQNLWKFPKEIDLSKMVALGGVNAANVFSLVDIGVGQFAVLGAVWNNDDPLKAFGEIKQTIARCQ